MAARERRLSSRNPAADSLSERLSPPSRWGSTARAARARVVELIFMAFHNCFQKTCRRRRARRSISRAAPRAFPAR